jgi:hypothetical protein
LFELLRHVIEVYPKIAALGGETVPTLERIATANHHPLQKVADQLVRDIAPTTLHIHPKMAYLRCQRCLVQCTAHEVKLASSPVTYFGCRVCHQSHDFFVGDHVIAVLDHHMPAEPVQQDNGLRVNWLPRRTLFDFNEVEIIRATDEEVERFAVQVGNDTDPVRRPHYKEMRCRVARSAGLSDNTVRILQRTFGQVEIG